MPEGSGEQRARRETRARSKPLFRPIRYAVPLPVLLLLELDDDEVTVVGEPHAVLRSSYDAKTQARGDNGTVAIVDGEAAGADPGEEFLLVVFEGGGRSLSLPPPVVPVPVQVSPLPPLTTERAGASEDQRRLWTFVRVFWRCFCRSLSSSVDLFRLSAFCAMVITLATAARACCC